MQDHFGQFVRDFKNTALNQIPPGYTVYTEYFFPDEIKNAYPDLDLKFCAWIYLYGNHTYLMSSLASECQPTDLNFKNFLSCFNRSNQNSRHQLLARLFQLGWYNKKYCTKHFPLDVGRLKHLGIDTDLIDRSFLESITTVDFESPVNHKQNFSILSSKIQDCFLHLVSETMSLDSLAPFPTEKFLYAIANRRLWIALAPPNYHKMINQTFGFELYSCFDYKFDSLWDSNDRLEMLLEMLKQFSSMTPKQWQEIYQRQQCQIEYNYQRLASFGFFDRLIELDQFPQHNHPNMNFKVDLPSAMLNRYLEKKLILPN